MSAPDILITSTNSTKYASNYSASFTDRSLVDKEYVDGAITAAGITASNGLTKTGNDITLGGTVTGNTQINSAGSHSFEIGFPDAFNAIVLNASSEINLTVLNASSEINLTSSFINMNAPDILISSVIINMSAPDILITSTNSTKYASNYSASFTDRSLVDKEYVDGAITAIPNITTSNGLTRTGNDIKLGGTLTEDTLISGAHNYTVDITNTSRDIKLFVKNNNSNETRNGLVIGSQFDPLAIGRFTANTYSNQSPNGLIVGMSLNANDSGQHFFGFSPDFTNASDGYNGIQVRSDGTILKSVEAGDVNETSINIKNFGTSRMVVSSSIATFEGITYDTDYSANYTNRSLVDKEYVINQINYAGTSGNITKYKTTITGNNSTTDFVITHSLNSRDVIVQTFTNTGSYETVEVAVERTSINTVTIKFTTAPANALEYRILINLI
jgi:hypothetical protein